MNKLSVNMLRHKKYLDLLNEIKKEKNDLSVIGLTDSQKAHLIYSLSEYSKKSACIVCSNNMTAKKFIQDFKFFTEREIVSFLPRDTKYYNIQAESREIENNRMSCINKILNKEDIIIVTTIDALTQKMLKPEEYNKLNITFKTNDKIDINNVITKLISLGFERYANVEGKGQFAIRGGILDIFPINSDLPYRIELFSDDIDSIRTFDCISQRSIDKIDSFQITFVKEFNIDEEQIETAIDKLQKLKNIDKELDININTDIEKMQNGDCDLLVDKYFNLFFKDSTNFLDYISDFTIYIDEPTKCKQKINSIIYENNEIIKMLVEKKHIYAEYITTLYDFYDIESKLKTLVNIYIEKINTDRVMHAKRREILFSAREVNFFRSGMDILIQDLQKVEGKIVLLVYPSTARVEQITNILKENNIKVINLDNKDEELKENNIYITTGILSRRI